MAVITDEQKAAEISEKEAAEKSSSDEAKAASMYPDDKSTEEGGDKSTEDKSAEDKEAEDKPAEDKPAEDKPKEKEAESTEPEAVTVADLKLPEGIAADEGIQDEFLKIINDKDMTAKERAQSMIGLQESLYAKAQEQYQGVIDGWAEDSQKDPTIVGADGTKKDENLALSNKGMNALKIDGLKDLLISSGYGNHPVFIKAFMVVGAMVSDDKFVSGEGKGAEGDASTVGERMYGKDGEGKKK